MIVGLAGYAQAGKDATGEILVRDHGFERRAFADALKEIALAIGWNGIKDDAGRQLLQNLGLAVRTNLHPDAWVWPVLRDMPERLVITDVRFPNEAESIKAVGGVMVRVERPGVGPVNGHVSEVAIDDWPYDGTVLNDGSLDALADTVKGLVRWLEASDGRTA